MLHVAVVLAVAVGWGVAAWLLLDTVVPGDLALPPVDVDEAFGAELVEEAERYERFLLADWVAAQVVALVTLALYARYGARYARESAAGPIGTGMLLGMLGLGDRLADAAALRDRRGLVGAPPRRLGGRATSRRSSAGGSGSAGRSSRSASRSSS